jgi:hypothetical protein
MHLALLTTFSASRKEPLAEVFERVHAAIVAVDFGEPQVQFVMADSPIAGGVSSIDRAQTLPDPRGIRAEPCSFYRGRINLPHWLIH